MTPLSRFLLHRLPIVLLGLLLGGVLLLGGLWLVLRQPEVQTRLAQWAAHQLSEQWGHQVTVDGVAIRGLGLAELRGVRIEDVAHRPMIAVATLEADFQLRTLWSPHGLLLDEVRLHQPDVWLYVDSATGEMNLNALIRAVSPPRTDTTTTGGATLLRVGKVSLTAGRFRYYDATQSALDEGFDYYHMDFGQLEGVARHLRVAGDTFELAVEHLRGHEFATGMPIREIRTWLRYTASSLHLDGLRAHVGNSYVGDTLRLTFDPENGFANFNENVHLDIRFDSTTLDACDLAHFVPILNEYPEIYRVRGRLTGTVQRFSVRDLHAQFGQGSYVRGLASFTGLPDVSETFIELELADARVLPADIRAYLPANDPLPYAYARKLGPTRFSGQFVGFPYDFVAKGQFQTQLGRLESDINLKLTEPLMTASTYQGKIRLQQFDLGRLTDQSALMGRVSLTGSVAGTGFSLPTARMQLDGRISQLALVGYNYQDIRVQGQLGRARFKGRVETNDPHLALVSEGTLDFHPDSQRVALMANIWHAHPEALRWAAGYEHLSGQLAFDFRGLSLDDIEGRVVMQDLALSYQQRRFRLDTLTFLAQRKGQRRDFLLQSPIVSGSMHGDFKFSEVLRDLPQLAREYALVFRNDSLASRRYYAQKKRTPTRNYNLQLDLWLHDVSSVLGVWLPGAYLSPGVRIEGSLASGYSSVITLEAQADSLAFGDYVFYDSQLDVTSSKVADENDVLAAVELSSRQQQFSPALATEALEFAGLWRDGQIAFDGGLQQRDTDNRLQLNGTVSFLPDRLELHLEPSQLQVLDRLWQIDTANRITLARFDTLRVENFVLTHQQQAVRIGGRLSSDPNDSLSVSMQDFQLDQLTPLLATDLQGNVNARLYWQSLLDVPHIRGDLRVDSLRIDGFPIGLVYGIADWDPQRRQVATTIDLNRDGRRFLRLDGTWRPGDSDEQLNLRAYLDKTDIGVLGTLLEGNFSDIEGQASGQLRLVGRWDAPLVLGEVMVENGRLRVDYLNTTYRFSDKIYFSENEIGVRNLLLYDENNRTARLTRGGLYHDGFQSFLVSLQGQLNNFQVLNTTARDNELFYGTANVSGSMEIFGPFAQLDVKANLRSERGTRLYIPLDNTEQTTRSEFIQFVSSRDTAQVGPAMRDNPWDGLRLDFTLDITEDAYGEIIFDAATGDIMKGRGNGRLKLEIDTRGDFNLFGQYAIQQGRYNFNYRRIIKKDFIIEPGSTISWNGDPFGGQLNVRAAYEQFVSFAPIVQATGADSADVNRNIQLNRKYPVQVMLGLTGDLLAPQIAMAIEMGRINDFPSALSSEIYAFQSALQRDEQELNRQVFSLLMLRSFSQPGSLSGVQQGAGNTLTELLSNQFSNLFSQLDENLQVNLDLNGFDQDALNALQLQLSYTLMDGRLRIVRGGGFTNARNEATVSSVAGDWSVEYVLMPSGQLRLKAFSRNNQNFLAERTTGVDNSSNITTGFSILHTQSFNRLRELLPLRRTTQETTDPAGPEPIPSPAVQRSEP